MSPKTAARSQIIINRECFFIPNLLKNRFWGRNFENVTPDSESALPRYHVCQFSGKTDNFNFFVPYLPKNEFWGWNFENISPDSESAPRRYEMCQFQAKPTTLTFSAQICPEMDFGIGISKI